ncbi:Uncharacterised protein [Klebsiella quasipneumoniae]|nr:Uncharacterised protein [Klebsiella quasipneumoniae]
MPLFNRFTRISAGWRFAYPAYKVIYLSEGYSTSQVRQAPRRRARTAGAEPLLCRVALRLPGLQRHLPIRRLLNTPGPASAAPPGKDSGRGAACVPGGASLTRPTKSFTYQKATQHPRPGKRRAAGQGQRARSRLCAGWRFAYPAYKVIYLSEGYSTPQTRQAPRRRARTAGAEPLLCRVALRLPGLEFVRPVVNLFTSLAETAGAGGLKIAETFPEGRGSPHGCGLRAVFCTDAASARPEACRDKSKGPRSGDFAGRSPGVQGAAATGRPLCAPCALPVRCET